MQRKKVWKKKYWHVSSGYFWVVELGYAFFFFLYNCIFSITNMQCFIIRQICFFLSSVHMGFNLLYSIIPQTLCSSLYHLNIKLKKDPSLFSTVDVSEVFSCIY